MIESDDATPTSLLPVPLRSMRELYANQGVGSTSQFRDRFSRVCLTRDSSLNALDTTPLPSAITFAGTGRNHSLLNHRKHVRGLAARRLQLGLCELANSDLTRPAIKFACLSGTRAPMGTIFINYRREDSISTAGRLHDRLSQTFGRKNIFMDVDHIPAGVDFVAHLNSQVAACNVFLVIIGPHWLEAKDENGARRFEISDECVC